MSEFRMPKIVKGIVFNDVSDEFSAGTYDLGQGWVLRRAGQEEVQNPIRQHMVSWASRNGHMGNFPLSMQVRRQIAENHHYNDVPPDERTLVTEHRVMVAEATREDALDHEYLYKAFLISDAELKVGLFTCIKNQLQYSRWQEFVGFRTGQDAFDRVPADQIPDLRKTISYMKMLESASTDAGKNVAHAVSLFQQLDRLPDQTPMKQLGYFVVIEALLTHKPNPDDPNDGIVRQLKRNLRMLDEELRTEQFDLGLESINKGSFNDKVYALYEHRSNIAHGSRVFDGKGLAPLLTSPPDFNFEKFMRKLARRALLGAILRPQKVHDAKIQTES